MKKNERVKRMRLLIEANAEIRNGSVIMYPGGTKILSAVPIDNNEAGQQEK